jgi:hypothetical protein
MKHETPTKFIKFLNKELKPERKPYFQYLQLQMSWIVVVAISIFLQEELNMPTYFVYVKFVSSNLRVLQN